MTNDTGQNQYRNSGTFVFVIDGQSLSMIPTQLSVVDNQTQLMTLCSHASSITIRGWEHAPSLPGEAQKFLFELMESSEATWQFTITGRPAVYQDPFAATMDLDLNPRDLRSVVRDTALAVAAAAHVCPEASSEAARRIREWLARFGIQSDSIPSLAAAIRGHAPDADQEPRWSPQAAARAVLANFQAKRQARGEIDITTPPIRYFQQDFYKWNGRTWVIEPQFESVVCRILQSETEGKDLTTAYIKSVISNLAALTLIDCRGIRLPVFVRAEDPLVLVETQTLALQNGTIDIGELFRGAATVALRPHDARIFLARELEYAFSATATCPLWERTLREIFPSQGATDHRIEVLQEFIGYSLMPSYHRFEAFSIFFGDGRNGKSTVLEVVGALLGAANTSEVPLDAFSNGFCLAGMFGRLANIAADMPRMAKVQEGMLKQLVSGEPVQVNRKYREPVTMRPTAKLIFATNYVPGFSDTSNGLWRRMIVLPFLRRFQGQGCDSERAFRIIETELPGVLNWALHGAHRLLRQNAFTECDVCQAAKIGHRHDSDPFLQFTDECLELRPDGVELVDEVYLAYHGFCKSNGKMPKSKSEVGKQFLGLDGVERQRECEATRRYYVYVGVRLLQGVLSWDSNTNEKRYRPPTRQTHGIR